MQHHSFWASEKALPAVSLKKIYVDLVDDLVTGLMLSQIAYWFRPSKNGKSKLKIERDGKVWLAKSKKDWLEECAISERQCRRAIKLLVEKGFVQTQIWKFAGVPTTHFWLDVDALAAAVAERTNQSVPNVQIHLYETDSSITETTTGMEELKALAQAPAANNVLKFPIKPMGDQMKAGDVLASMKGPSTAAAQWLKHQAAETGYSQLTLKQKGQLKMLAQKVPDVKKAIDWLWENWPKFANKVGWSKGISTTPEKPVIGFALAHVDVLLQLIAEPEDIGTVVFYPGPELQPMNIVEIQPIQEKPITKEEMIALMAKLA